MRRGEAAAPVVQAGLQQVVRRVQLPEHRELAVADVVVQAAVAAVGRQPTHPQPARRT